MKSELIQLFAINMKRLRQDAGITQEELSFRSGIHRNYISDAERGARNVTIKIIEKIAHGLGIQPEELLKQPSGKYLSQLFNIPNNFENSEVEQKQNLNNKITDNN
ncbi:helix-turn-helix transcriptional regulator [Spiroplasma endosymbiont of Labia minor]|uniref:helix-turn-helix domain-containing protein n=1 Tax=Spiroplasma endosymbiont of Labia minor TaxID=3066305 RepID=UPI0030CCACE7